ncbi:MAG: transposase [Deltaproteobacteria bacterium]|nr:transposase [Deltaproteobacteria bacterium]
MVVEFNGVNIPSDPELENQINDRLSFKKFLGLSFSKPSPDHSTFSRFRSRLSKASMEQIHPVTNCDISDRYF